jgi:glutamate transport system permease protein
MAGGVMANSILFDAPGPRTRARHRLYAVLSTIGLALLAVFVIWRFWVEGQLTQAYWEPFVTPRIVVFLLQGLMWTLLMALVAVVGSVVIGAILGIAKLSEHRAVRWPAWLWVEFWRAVPLLMAIIAMWFALGARAGWTAYWAVVVGLWLYNGSVLAEIVRAGINALPKGQSEAAYALGMRKTAVMSSILLPQGVKIMLPAIISQSIVALKDTSLGYAVLAYGLTTNAKQVFGEFHNIIPTALVVAAIYITCNLGLSWLATWTQRRFGGERKLEVHVTGATIKQA